MKKQEQTLTNWLGSTCKVTLFKDKANNLSVWNETTNCLFEHEFGQDQDKLRAYMNRMFEDADAVVDAFLA